jgi:transposase
VAASVGTVWLARGVLRGARAHRGGHRAAGDQCAALAAHRGGRGRGGSRQIRVFTPKQVAKLRAELARGAHPRHDLTDAQWEKVAPIVSRPPKQRSGRIPADRAIINAIRWIQRTGASWEAMPDRYPPRSTCQAHFLAWKLDGTWATAGARRIATSAIRADGRRSPACTECERAPGSGCCTTRRRMCCA